MIAFIDDARDAYGVEPICKQLPIAVSTYYEHKTRQSDPDRAPERVKRDRWLKVEIQRVWDENLQVYGAKKVWRQLKREGIVVARCTVARLMKALGIQVSDGPPGRFRSQTIQIIIPFVGQIPDYSGAWRALFRKRG